MCVTLCCIELCELLSVVTMWHWPKTFWRPQELVDMLLPFLNAYQTCTAACSLSGPHRQDWELDRAPQFPICELGDGNAVYVGLLIEKEHGQTRLEQLQEIFGIFLLRKIILKKI